MIFYVYVCVVVWYEIEMGGHEQTEMNIDEIRGSCLIDLSSVAIAPALSMGRVRYIVGTHSIATSTRSTTPTTHATGLHLDLVQDGGL